MSSVYSQEAQQQIGAAENKLGDAIANLKSQIKSNDDPRVEVMADETPDMEVSIEAPKQLEKEPRRSEFVKTDDPKVLERINDLYGQVKKSDARNQMILEHNRQLEERLAEFVQKVDQVERYSRDTASNKVESELKSALKSAREDGDFDRIDDIENKLLDLRMEKRLAEKLQPMQDRAAQQQQQQQQRHPQQQQFETQLVHNAHYIENLANEKDQSGNLVRPYLYDWHPDNRKAVELFESIPKEFAAAGKQVDMKTMMEVLDERVRGKRQRPTTSVLGGDGNDAPVRQTIRLTQQEVEVAKKMGLTPERYAKQKQLINS